MKRNPPPESLTTSVICCVLLALSLYCLALVF
jgi:hypothetical protein